MTITTSKWDASKFLDSPEMIKEYLQIMLEENGVDGCQRALGDIAKARSMSELAGNIDIGFASIPN